MVGIGGCVAVGRMEGGGGEERVYSCWWFGMGAEVVSCFGLGLGTELGYDVLVGIWEAGDMRDGIDADAEGEFVEELGGPGRTSRTCGKDGFLDNVGNSPDSASGTGCGKGFLSK